jgi:hypothetical protein
MNCPKCNTPLKRVIYGLPTAEMMENPDIILAGCVIDDESKPYQCIECGVGFERKEIEGNSWSEALKGSDFLTDWYDDVYPDYTKVIEELESEYAGEGLKIKEAGGAVPVQATGDLLGKHFYFRFRHNNARLMVGDYVDEKSLPANASQVEIRGVTDDSLNGFLTAEEFKEVMSKLLRMYLTPEEV